MRRIRRALRDGGRKVRRGLIAVIRRLLSHIDWDDFAFLCGLAGIGAGLYGIDWRLAATVLGGLLVYVGLFYPLREGRD